MRVEWVSESAWNPQASKDINSYIAEYAPKNLEYDKHLKGYVPSRHFRPLFIDDSASAYLHLLNQNHDRAPYVEGLALAYAHTEVLDVPDRSVRPEVLRPLLKACREGLRLECEYVSFTTPDGETRLIAPHTLIFTGMRWHVRAYCEKNRDYRDFVLSRFRGVPELMDDESINTRDDDLGWNTRVQVIIEPDSRLKPEQQAIIETDYGMQDGKLIIETRGALVHYVLQRYQIDPAKVHAKATAQQIVVANLDELQRWLYH
ncbi:WYL domain-containing protein [Stutzerimonas stutzeri]|nr:WYL domain-containing protein [Stutzerimonas stutzeri]